MAREGWPFILSTAIPAIVLLDAAAMFGGPILWGFAAALSILALGVLAFFRDPQRSGPRGPDLIVAPADGRIVEIVPVTETSYVNGDTVRVSIFLSLFDVHINRYPVTGSVQHRSYNAGGYEPAWRSSASHSNERSSTGIYFKGGPLLVNQIAGLAAKRIVNYAEIGDEVEQGERMGLIRFGSRVDVYMPTDVELEVKAGQRAVGGITILARLPDSRGSEA
ncbi:MAG: phosphatidylserine decarboxylase family protein [Gemmatimonadetes bacterium]|nr:phosphatidylserine decarboxylase family protein [Gemmatimonadota bacterium]NIY37527.1 phosphatidylserine decarboxylase family protein [Gemmatimonadota bacterium]